MKNLLLSAAAAALLCFTATAQQNLPYSTGFATQADQDFWQVYRVGPEQNPSYSWVFESGHMQHYYPVGGSDVTDDWMVSQAFDFGTPSFVDSLQFRGAGFGTPFGDDTIALYLLKGSRNPDSATTKTLLHVFTDSSYMNDNVWYTHTNITIGSHAEPCYLAFRYRTINNWLDVSIDNLHLDAVSVGMEELQALQLQVFPNPATDVVQLKGVAPAQVTEARIYNTAGQLMFTNSHTNQLNISNLIAGVYIIEVRTLEGVARKRLLVQ